MSWLDDFLRRWRAEPDPEPRGDPERVRQAAAALADLAPLLAIDGGDVRLVAVEGDAVVLEWRGACRSCPSRAQTLSQALEPTLRARLAWLAEIRSA